MTVTIICSVILLPSGRCSLRQQVKFWPPAGLHPAHPGPSRAAATETASGLRWPGSMVNSARNRRWSTGAQDDDIANTPGRLREGVNRSQFEASDLTQILLSRQRATSQSGPAPDLPETAAPVAVRFPPSCDPDPIRGQGIQPLQFLRSRTPSPATTPTRAHLRRNHRAAASGSIGSALASVTRPTNPPPPAPAGSPIPAG